MARPIKEGLDYFSLDCTLDDKVYMIEVELGLEGFALFIKLLMKIYGESYYIEWVERKAKIFSRQNNTTIETVNKLINICLSEGIFNRELYKKYNILTSNGIQKRYFHSIKDRKEIVVIKEYLLNGITDQYINSGVNLVINSIKPQINSIKPPDNTHSIVKDSIGKKREYAPAVFMTEDEYQKLVNELGDPLTKEYMKDLSLYLQSKGKQYKSHYATILAWHRKDEKEGKIRKPQEDETQPKYIPKREPAMTPEQIARNLAKFKELKEKLNNKFNIPETVKGG